MKGSFIITVFMVFSLYLSMKDTTISAASSLPKRSHDSNKNQHVVFTKNIAPLIFANCTPCHRPGQVAPFSLITYDDARKHSKEIVELTANRQMPPWKAKHGYVNFIGERRLSDGQIKMIGQWVRSGMEFGEEKDLPPVPKYNDAWQLGTPDYIAYMPESITIPPDGHDFFRVFILPIDLPEDK